VGEILCLAAMSSGLYVSQKNDYPITVLRGHSIAELVFDTEPIGYTGMVNPKVIICAAQEGVDRRKALFKTLSKNSLVLKWAGFDIPPTEAKVSCFAVSEVKVKKTQVGMALSAMLAQRNIIISVSMLEYAITTRYSGGLREEALGLLHGISPQRT
jgi:Pyruvate/2-oxoacid:ferredoxin oxidoreductase gamma subunit